MKSNEGKITNHNQVTDNSVILNAVELLVTSASFNKDELNIAFDAIKNARAQSLVSKKQYNTFWWIKHSSIQVLTTDLSAKRGTSVSGK